MEDQLDGLDEADAHRAALREGVLDRPGVDDASDPADANGVDDGPDASQGTGLPVVAEVPASVDPVYDGTGAWVVLVDVEGNTWGGYLDHYSDYSTTAITAAGNSSRISSASK